MGSSRRRSLALAVVAATTWTARARAQPTVKVNTSVLRLASDETTQIPTLVVHGNQPGIGFKDCAGDTFVRFPLTVTGLPTSDSLQAWAGTGDCTQQGATTTQTATCWPIYDGSITPTSSGFYVDIRVQDIVSQLYSTAKTLVYSPASSDVCQNQGPLSTISETDGGGASIPSGEANVNVFFMWFQPGAATPESSATPYAIKVKLVGPAAPTDVAAGVGDGVLVLSWIPPSGEADLQGFHLFAAPAASAVEDAAAGVTSVCSDAAPSDDAGDLAPEAGCYEVYVLPTAGSQCAGTPVIDVSAATSTSVGGPVNAKGVVTNLENGTTYAVAVAGYDSFQNDGPLSNIACGTPEPVDDFWKRYHEDGGGASGCALGSSGSGGDAGLLALACGAALARRKRARRG
jgi:hypothetical protein